MPKFLTVRSCGTRHRGATHDRCSTCLQHLSAALCRSPGLKRGSCLVPVPEVPWLAVHPDRLASQVPCCAGGAASPDGSPVPTSDPRPAIAVLSINCRRLSSTTRRTPGLLRQPLIVDRVYARIAGQQPGRVPEALLMARQTVG